MRLRLATGKHRRGEVSFAGNPPEYSRGSVWIEQEIGIAAFLRQMLGRDIQVIAFVEAGVKMEGIRELLHLNPREFRTNDEVLSRLEVELPSWEIVTSSSNVEILLEHKNVQIQSDHHLYQLCISLQNSSSIVVKDWRVDLWMPTPVLLDTNYATEVKEAGTRTHRLFRWKSEGMSELYIYQGDPPKLVVEFDWQMHEDIWRGEILDQNIIVEAYINEEFKVTKEVSVRDLQIY